MREIRFPGHLVNSILMCFCPTGGVALLPRGFAVPVSLTVPLGVGTMLPTYAASLRVLHDTNVCTHAISTLDDRSRQVCLP